MLSVHILSYECMQEVWRDGKKHKSCLRGSSCLACINYIKLCMHAGSLERWKEA